MKRKAAIFDLDSTLTNPGHRLHHLHPRGNPPRANWDAFNGACHLDPPNEWCLTILRGMYYSGVDPLMVTGRHESTASQTMQWLHQHAGVTAQLWENLFMRRRADGVRHDYLVKKELYETHIRDKYEVLFVIDDRRRVINMWRSIGLTALHCDDWDDQPETEAVGEIATSEK